MTWYRVGPAGIPGSLKTDMDAVLNKKFGTSTTYPPNTWPDNVNLLGPLPERTASGAIAHIDDGADGVPLKNWLVTLPASLSGYSEVNGVRSGKNLLAKDIVRYANSLATLSECFAIHHGTYTVTIGTVANANNWRLSVLLMDGEGNALTDNAYKPSNDLQLATNRWRYGSNTTSKVFTVTIVTDCYIRFFIELGDTSSSTTVTDSYLEVGSTATSYEAYSAPTQYTASLGRTIYGGQADIVTGEGSNGSILIDLSELTWNMDNDTRFRSRQTDYTGASGWSGSWQNTVSNRFVCENPATAFTNRSDYSFANIPQNYYNFDIKVPTGIFQDATEFKAWLANVDGNGTHAVVVIDRLNADTFTFTPIQADTELGVNNFWADEGDSDVTYRADIDLALNA